MWPIDTTLTSTFTLSQSGGGHNVMVILIGNGHSS